MGDGGDLRAAKPGGAGRIGTGAELTVFDGGLDGVG